MNDLGFLIALILHHLLGSMQPNALMDEWRGKRKSEREVLLLSSTLRKGTLPRGSRYTFVVNSHLQAGEAKLSA